MTTQSLQLPNDLMVEQEVLSIFFLDSSDETIEVLEFLKPQDFFNRANRVIFEVIKLLYSQGKPFDMISIQSVLTDGNQLSHVGGHYYLSKISTKFTVGFMGMEGAKILKEKTKLRGLIELSEEIKNRSYDCQNSFKTAALIEKSISDISLGETSNDNLVEKASLKISEMIKTQKSGTKVSGVTTGIKSFDDMFFGLQKSQYYVFAGRPSAGKTAIVDQFCCNLISKDIPVLYVGLESSEERILGKIACKMARISYTRFVQRKCNDAELDSIEGKMKFIQSKPFYLKRPMSLTSDALKSLVMREHRKHGAQVLVVDYLQKIIGDSEDPRIGVMRSSMVIQNICVETGMTGLIICQMNRTAETEKRPRMGHLKESGQIEQDADNIVMLWSEKDNFELGAGEMKPSILTVEKNKDGIQGVDIKLLFDRELMTFKEREIHVY